MQDDRDSAWLGPMLRQSTTAPPPSGACADAETLAAWVEGTLDAKQAALVEQHSSTCPRCMAMLAALERTTPPPAPPAESWNTLRILRWLMPLTAAATAVAIWVTLPDRPATQVQPAPAASVDTSSDQIQARRLEREQQPPAASAPEPAPPPAAEPALPAAPSAVLEKQAAPEEARRDTQLADEMKTERARIDPFGARQEAPQDQAAAALPPATPSAAPPATPSDARVAPSTAPSAPSAAPTGPSAAARRAEAAANIVRENVLVDRGPQQTLAEAAVPTSESISPTDSLIRWRIVGWMSVERSIDAGMTWIRTSLPPGVTPASLPMLWVVSVRAVDNLRGVIVTSDRTEFYTTNGGITWERVQENSAAPF